MIPLRLAVRKSVRWTHLWIGLIAGLLFCLMGVTGGIVAFRPQITAVLSPSPVRVASCVQAVDWNQAEREITAFSASAINRIYAPPDGDPRYHFRMVGDSDKIYKHVIYDGCAARILGTANLAWMDWVVDLHHNLLAEDTGRKWGGAIGVVMLLSGIGGWILWLLNGAKWRKVFRIGGAGSGLKTSLDLHRSFGLIAGSLLMAGSFTSLWLCFPQTMRAMVAWVTPVPASVRAPRAPKGGDAAPAGLGHLMGRAERAIPDGRIREIRMPEGYGNVQIRMWRRGDFRSLGNNVVSVDRGSGRVMGVDLYAGKPAGNRWIQAMAGLHYGEWGGLPFRFLYGISAFASVLLLVTGTLLWWLPKRRRASAPARTSTAARETVAAAN